MKRGQVISYTGIDGKRHTLKYLEPGFVVKWHKTLPPSESGRFLLDDLTVVQVPFAALQWSKEMGFVKDVAGDDDDRPDPPPMEAA